MTAAPALTRAARNPRPLFEDAAGDIDVSFDVLDFSGAATTTHFRTLTRF